MSENINNAIGAQLKLARTNKGWSLDTTCKHTGVSKAMLGQIERGESSPTVARLWKIASGFHLPLSYFFGAIVDNNLTQSVLNTEEGITISTLFPFDSETKSEVLSLILDPLHQQMSLPHNDGVIEHILVIEGEIEYFLNEQWHHLRKGEVVKFNANKKHGYRNMSENQAIFHNIICYTGEDKSSF
ncbi:MAG: XRE family transcriptional regulator [Colwellia sp.]|jgi:Predicted transcriptional regulators